MEDSVRRQLKIATALVLLLGMPALVVWMRAVYSTSVPPLPPPPPVYVADSGVVSTSTGEDAPEEALRAVGPGWRVTNRYSAHWALIVKVETVRLEDARQIAEDIIEPVKKSYDEALVYFYRPARGRVLAAARVQWTPRRGYEVMRFDAEDGR